MPKQCKQCKKTKPLDQFYRLKSQADGYHYYCKQCCKIRRGTEEVKKRDKKKGISNRQQYRVRVELQADPTTIDKDITLEEVYKRAKGICALCNKWVMPKHASIDHKKPLSKGGTHTWDNVQLMHVRCNKVKGAKEILNDQK